MSLKIGYLLPTRENVMAGKPATRPLLDAARTAESLGFDSLWVGDSLLARPRHDPLTLLGAVASITSTAQLGTAVLLSALRNPVVLAQQLATLDQLSEGRLVVGAGIAADNPAIRAEFKAAGVPFEGRVGRMTEGFRLCRELWSGKPVDWDGRWQVTNGTLGPEPWTPGGPPIWVAGGVPAAIERAARHYDGWFPIGPDAQTFGRNSAHFTAAAIAAGRDPQTLTRALYMTVAIDPDGDRADQRINTYLEQYYGVPAHLMRNFQACFGGPLDSVLQFIRSYVDQGVDHLVLRLVGEDHAGMLAQIAAERHQLE